MNPAPIFLLIDGEANGPHEAADILDKIDDELPAETLSCVEEMKDWRVLEETLVWSHAQILPSLPGISDFITTQKADDLRECRSFAQQFSKDRFYLGLEYIGRAIKTNALLFREHKNYCDSGKWNSYELEEFPAEELIEMGTPKYKRDWHQAWQAAGGKIFNGKMIAAKGDPVWIAISDFGYPCPPFSFDHAFWTQSVDRKEALEYGIRQAAAVTPFIKPFEICGVLAPRK